MRASTATFLFWTIATGIGSSWFATILWNVASKRPPVSLVGFLIGLEDAVRPALRLHLRRAGPRPLEIVAIVLTVAGVATATLAHRPREGGAGS